MKKTLAIFLCLFFLSFPKVIQPEIPKTPSPQTALFGIASWYSESDPGINLRTANGEIFNDSKRTCASWDFPFGTYLHVTHLANGKAVLCRINDRGPAKRLNRLVDLTKESFREIAPLETGLISVKVEVAGTRESASRSRSQREVLQPR